jgi:GH15 family glucan-1,4-alpha-glucosidase
MSIRPLEKYESEHLYEGDSNILHTLFTTPTGKARIIDFMPLEEIDRDDYNFQEVHRILEVTQGHLQGDVEFQPAFDYARVPTVLTKTRHGILATGAGQRLVLSSDQPFEIDQGVAFSSWDLHAGERLRFVLRFDTRFPRPVDAYGSDEKLEMTRAYWHRWIGRCSYRGRYADKVKRSALTLKLLTYSPTGAFAAAATTSLPETIGGERNWDYRYSWIRDSAFALEAMHGVGYSDLARRYLRWMRRLLRGLSTNVGDLRVCYGLEGESDLHEATLDHLRGYLDSRPVRIGNAAALQTQHDIYGAIANAFFEAYQRPEGFPDEAWRSLRALAEHVLKIWEKPDHGIWEIRGPVRRYTHSALMCWCVLDRSIKVASLRGHPESAEGWISERDRMREEIESKGWNEAKKAFVMTLDGGDDLDASLLAIPLVDFLPGTDPRVLSTLTAIDAELGQGPFIRRYKHDDGLAGSEGAFLILSFWMVCALARGHQVAPARRRFDELLGLAGPLGLYSEQVDPATRTALGNFPQAFTHLAMVNAALDLHAAETQVAPTAQERVRRS